jgi:hypothetical protein
MVAQAECYGPVWGRRYPENNPHLTLFAPYLPKSPEQLL